MAQKSFFWRLYLSYALIIFLCLTLLGGYTAWGLGAYMRSRFLADLHARSLLASAVFMPILVQQGPDAAQAKVRALGREIHMRITVIRADGTVLADSEEEPSRMDNHADRPEVKAALQGEVKGIERYSNTLKLDMLYMAVPVNGPEGARYVIRTAIPLGDVKARLRAMYVILCVGGLLALVLALGLGYVVVRRITRPLLEMEHQARRLAEGDLNTKFWSDRPDEIGRLAETMNYMVAQLDEKMRSLIQERNEREAILSSMIEGVIAVDATERILMVNQAAREILNLPAYTFAGKPVLEVVRNSALQRFLREVLESNAAREAEVELIFPTKRMIKLTGAPLLDESGHTLGCVAVLNDITRLRALERMRSEFVANVSHELKTPITTIKAYIETLRDEAIADRQKAVEFLDIVAKHADRLNAIVDDLLSLSRIESDAHAIALVPLDLRLVVARSLDSARGKATTKQITLIADEMVEPLPVMGNANLLEQALVNVLDNAIKFSPEKTSVKISAFKRENEVEIQVADQGIGIPEKDLPRIFERFYRVDKGRSRDLGGTGLGLAIVKHIVLAHKGTVTAQSTLGQGSVFTIRLPLAAALKS